MVIAFILEIIVVDPILVDQAFIYTYMCVYIFPRENTMRLYLQVLMNFS